MRTTYYDEDDILVIDAAAIGAFPLEVLHGQAA